MNNNTLAVTSNLIGLACYLALTIEVHGPHGAAAYSRPLLPLTRPLAAWLRLKASLGRSLSRLAVGLAIAAIVISAVKWGAL